MKLKICCATDENYTEMTSVMIASILANARERVSAIHVFCYRLSRRSVAVLAGLAPDLVVIHDHPTMPAEIAAVPVAVRPSAAMWMRIIAPDVIEPNDEHMLYVDCDAIVDAPLDELAEMDMAGFVVGAVEDFAKAKHAGWNQRLGLPLDTPYFNSGVLLFDHRRYRDEGWSKRIIAVARAMPDKLIRVDQDAINVVCAGRWLPLDKSWNAHASSARTKRGGVPEVFDGARIVHYVGRRKPTDVDCTHAAKDVFLRYRALTPYGTRPLRGVARREIYNHVRAGVERCRVVADRLARALGLGR